MTKKILTILTIGLWATCICSFSQTKGELRTIQVGVYINPPLVQIDSTGKIEGLFIDVLNYVAKKRDWKLTYDLFSLEGALKAIKENKIQLLPAIAYTSQRTQDMLFSKTAIFHNWGMVFTSVDSKVENIADMNGINLGLEEGDIHADAFINLMDDFNVSANIHWFESQEKIIEALKNGQIEAIAANKLIGFTYRDKTLLRETSILFNPVHVHFTANKISGQLLDELNADVLTLLENDPEIYNNMITKWFLTPKEEKHYFLTWPGIILAFTILVLITTLLFLRLKIKAKNKNLLNELQAREANEELIAQLENEKALILNSIEDQVLFIDRNYNILWTNKAYKVFANNNLESKIGEKCYKTLFNNNKPCSFCRLENGNSIDQTHVHEHFDESTDSYFLIKTTSVYNRKNKLIGFVKVISDITDKKHTENELIKAKEKAEKDDYLKSAFLANMSHEIRTPMNAIIGFSELLEDEELEPDQKRSYLNIIQSNGQQLLKLISDILVFSQLESGHIEIHCTTINIVDLLNEVYQQFTTKVDIHTHKNINISLNTSIIQPELLIITDTIRLKQVLFNLMTNAIKFTKEGEINISAYIEKDMLVLEVKDTGIGIPNDQLKRIFKRFSQVENPQKRKAEGSGLGLTIANDLMAMMGGYIDVQSEVHIGSTFKIHHPID